MLAPVKDDARPSAFWPSAILDLCCVTMPAKWQCRVCCNAVELIPRVPAKSDQGHAQRSIGNGGDWSASAVGPANVIALTPKERRKNCVGMEPMLEKGKIDRSEHDQQPALATYHIARRIACSPSGSDRDSSTRSQRDLTVNELAPNQHENLVLRYFYLARDGEQYPTRCPLIFAHRVEFAIGREATLLQAETLPSFFHM